MEFTTLGRTGLRVSRMGLGCGGHSRLGLGAGGTEENAITVVRAALDLGVNFIDTAESYRTEDVVGRALQGQPREHVVLSTKAGVGWEGRRSTRNELRERVHACLGRLRTECVDVFHLHGVRADEYAYARDELLPELQLLKEEGKIRAIGITEAFAPDPTHQMLSLAVQDDGWEVMMVGFNILNQSARERILAFTRQSGTGTLCMFAVRRALSRPDVLRQQIQEMVATGLVDGSLFDLENPLGFLRQVADSVTEASYRFCRWEPGMDVILSGTGSVDHLGENADSINGPPLPADVTETLRRLFEGVDSVSGN